MASSGFVVDDSSLAEFELVKKRKSVYVVFKAAEGKVLPDVVGSVEQKKTYDDLVSYLSETCEKLPRFVAVDFPYETKDGRQTSKVLFIYWSPDKASVRDKMLYSSTLDAIKQKLQGVHAKNVQATVPAELDAAAVKDVLNLE